MLQYLRGPFTKPAFGRHDTESFLFYLHYRVTFLIIMTCCILVWSCMVFGEPIICIDAPYISYHLRKSYCWANATLLGILREKPKNVVVCPSFEMHENEHEYIYHDYYDWMHVVLFLQGVSFYLPRSMWKSIENGKMELICKTIVNLQPVDLTLELQRSGKVTKVEQDGKVCAAAEWFYDRLGQYRRYAFLYWLCEIMAWLNVILQTCVIHYFLHGEFISLGNKALEYFRSEHVPGNSVSWVFSRSANCHFERLGPNDVIKATTDLPCLLTINILAEKIYLFLWFWFALLFSLSSLGILLTIMTMACPTIRGLRLSLQVRSLYSTASVDAENFASALGESLGHGDWFVMSVLAKKMDVLDFEQFLFLFCQQVILGKKTEKNVGRHKWEVKQ